MVIIIMHPWDKTDYIKSLYTHKSGDNDVCIVKPLSQNYFR